MQKISNIQIKNFKKLISPNEIRTLIPASDKSIKTINKGREEFCDIIRNKDNRFVAIMGPCSIHSYESAMEYANKLKKLNNKVSDKLLIIMRTYFEKPRTTVGWKGLISDNALNGEKDMEAGLKLARKILIEIAEIGLPTATELLDPIIAAYLAELVSWVAIGARTTESQTHREMASGLSAPIGFKNNTDGNIDVAVNAMQSARSSHSFLGVNDNGECSIVETNGNPNTHIVLRGGKGEANYSAENVKNCEEKLQKANFTPKIMIDCSHENSGKDYKKQHVVLEDIIAQKKSGNKSIFAAMLESNLFEGRQDIPLNLDDLKHGVSVTDGCVGWEETEDLLLNLYKSI